MSVSKASLQSDLTEAIRAQRVVVASGIVLGVRVNGEARMGWREVVRPGSDGTVPLEITVQAPAWVTARDLVVFENGRPLALARVAGQDAFTATVAATESVDRARLLATVRTTAVPMRTRGERSTTRWPPTVAGSVGVVPASAASGTTRRAPAGRATESTRVTPAERAERLSMRNFTVSAALLRTTSPDAVCATDTVEPAGAT